MDIEKQKPKMLELKRLIQQNDPTLDLSTLPHDIPRLSVHPMFRQEMPDTEDLNLLEQWYEKNKWRYDAHAIALELTTMVLKAAIEAEEPTFATNFKIDLVNEHMWVEE